MLPLQQLEGEREQIRLNQEKPDILGVSAERSTGASAEHLLFLWSSEIVFAYRLCRSYFPQQTHRVDP